MKQNWWDYTFADIDFFFGASSFNFKENRVLIEEDKPCYSQGRVRLYIEMTFET